MKRDVLPTIVLLLAMVGAGGCSTPFWASTAKTSPRVSAIHSTEGTAASATLASGSEETGVMQGISSWWSEAVSRPFHQAGKNLAETPVASQDQGDAKMRAALSMAMLSERRGQADQARHLYEEFTRRDPRNPTPYWRLGVMAGKAGKFREAESYLTKAASLLPNDPELACDLGYIYYLDHRLDLAEKTLRAALEESPEHTRTCNNLALVLCDQGKDEQAFELFRTANGPASAYANLGYAYAQRGEIDKAKAAYTRALALDSSLRPAVDAMEQLSGASRSSGINLARYESPIPTDSAVQAIREGSEIPRRRAASAAAIQPMESGARQPAAKSPGRDVAAPPAPEPVAALSPTLLNQQQHQRMLNTTAFARQAAAAPTAPQAGAVGETVADSQSP